MLTIFLSARNEQLWLYYGFMATVGSVAGGFVTYRLARKGGKETLARRFPPKTLDKVYKTFERWGLAQSQFPPYYRRLCPCFHSCLARAPCNIR